MTSKQETWYGYWSNEQSKNRGYFKYNSAHGPISVTEVSDIPPEIFLKDQQQNDNRLIMCGGCN